MAFLARFPRLLSGLVFLLLIQPLGAAAADSLQLAEQKIKVGLLYHFIKNITLAGEEKEPEDNPIDVCIYGEYALTTYLRPMQGLTVNLRKIELHHIARASETEECDVIYFSEPKSNWEALHRHVQNKNILTVSDAPGFAARGGMIQFIKKGSHIGALFNLDALKKAGLHVNESLLRVSGVEIYAESAASGS